MPAKNKALLLVVLMLVLGGAADGCSAQLGGGGSDSKVVKAEDGGEEEVLSEDSDEDRDEFGRLKSDGADGPKGLLIAITYVLATVGSMALPFLMLM